MSERNRVAWYDDNFQPHMINVQIGQSVQWTPPFARNVYNLKTGRGPLTVGQRYRILGYMFSPMRIQIENNFGDVIWATATDFSKLDPIDTLIEAVDG